MLPTRAATTCSTCTRSLRGAVQPKGIIIGKGGARLKEVGTAAAGSRRRCSAQDFPRAARQGGKDGSATRASCARSASDRFRRTCRPRPGHDSGWWNEASVEPDVLRTMVVVGAGRTGRRPGHSRAPAAARRPARTRWRPPGSPGRDDHAGAAAAVEHKLEAAQPAAPFHARQVSSFIRLIASSTRAGGHRERGQAHPARPGPEGVRKPTTTSKRSRVTSRRAPPPRAGGCRPVRLGRPEGLGAVPVGRADQPAPFGVDDNRKNLGCPRSTPPRCGPGRPRSRAPHRSCSGQPRTWV